MTLRSYSYLLQHITTGSRCSYLQWLAPSHTAAFSSLGVKISREPKSCCSKLLKPVFLFTWIFYYDFMRGERSAMNEYFAMHVIAGVSHEAISLHQEMQSSST